MSGVHKHVVSLSTTHVCACGGGGGGKQNERRDQASHKESNVSFLYFELCNIYTNVKKGENGEGGKLLVGVKVSPPSTFIFWGKYWFGPPILNLNC